MTATEWLEKNGRAPWSIPVEERQNSYEFFHWCCEEELDTSNPDHDDDMRFAVPMVIWNCMTQKTTYPECKMYWTKQDALDDFNQAFDAAIQSGWLPA